MPDQPRFATCTYQEMDPSYGIPVKTTVGHPRFKLRYPLEFKLSQIAPDRNTLHLGITEFRDAYFAKLDRLGVQKIKQLGAIISQDQTLVLLCFDKLAIPGKWCHRTLFGEWWSEEAGEDVPEYGATPHHGTRPIVVPTLAEPLF